MEDKKVLNDEKIEEVSGGRRYVKEPRILSPEKKEELMKSSVTLNAASRSELPKELLTQIAGGDIFMDAGDICPYCGGPVEMYYGGYDNWLFYCGWCSRTLAGSDFWLEDDEDW